MFEGMFSVKHLQNVTGTRRGTCLIEWYFWCQLSRFHVWPMTVTDQLFISPPRAPQAPHKAATAVVSLLSASLGRLSDLAPPLARRPDSRHPTPIRQAQRRATPIDRADRADRPVSGARRLGRPDCARSAAGDTPDPSMPHVHFTDTRETQVLTRGERADVVRREDNLRMTGEFTGGSSTPGQGRV